MATYDINNLGQAIYAKLNALLLFTGGIYPQRIPEGSTWPACSYYIISNIPEEVKDNGAVVDQVRLQVSIFATTYSSVQTLADAVRVALVGTTGETNSTTIDTIRLVDETDMYEDDVAIYHRAQDYLVRIKNLVLGPELIVGGDMSSASSWELFGSVSFSGGVFSLTDPDLTGMIRQDILTAGSQYYITLFMANYSGGTVEIGTGTSQYLSTNGYNTLIMTASPYARFSINLSTTNATIDNVSVKKII